MEPNQYPLIIIKNIFVIDYFTYWVEAMPTFKYNMGVIATHFFFNHVIACFGVHKELASNNVAPISRMKSLKSCLHCWDFPMSSPLPIILNQMAKLTP